MPERITKAPHVYADRKLNVGDPFECEAGHVDLLLGLGRIEAEPGELGYIAPHQTEVADASIVDYAHSGARSTIKDQANKGRGSRKAA